MAPEGRIILIPLLTLAMLAGIGLLWVPQPWLKQLAVLLWVLAGLSLVFFRDPVRRLPDDPDAVVSPADGKIVAIERLDFNEHVGGAALQISIFLSIFSVHVQRVPADARVDSIGHRSGKFRAAFSSTAGEENTQAVTYLTGDKANYAVKQISGAVARRILCHMQPQQRVRRGDRLGYIRFGSRVELIVPADFQVLVKLGQRVKGGISNMGYFTS